MSKFALYAAVLTLPVLLAAAPMPAMAEANRTAPGQALPGEASEGPEPGNAVSGKALYEKNCMYCHGMNGKGLGGQQVTVLLEKMKTFHQMKTFNNPRIQGMHDALVPMNPQNLEDLAAYIHSM